MKTFGQILLIVVLLAGSWAGWRWYQNQKKSAAESWIQDFNDTFNQTGLNAAWFVPPVTKSVTTIELKDFSLHLENQKYSPYSEIWLQNKYEGPVRIEFDLKLNLKRGGEFGVRLANSQTEILPNTPGYEIYLVSLTSAVIKRADRDEQVNASFRLPDSVLQGEKFFHVSAEKDFRKVRFWVENQLVLELPDPEILSGSRYARCGFFLIAGQAIIKDFSISVYPKSDEHDFLAQAYEFYTGGDYSQAIKLYDKFLVDKPNDRRAFEARFRKALCHKYLGNYNESVGRLQGLLFNVADKEFVPDALFFLGEIYQKIRQFDDALKYYTGFIEQFSRHPYMPRAYEQLAICQQSLKKHQEALNTIDILQEKYPESIIAIHSHYLRGQILESLNEKAKAIEEYKTLLRLVQKDAIANLARKSLRQLEKGTAVESVKNIWKKDSIEIVYTPDIANPLHNALEIFLHWGRNGWQQVQDTPMAKLSSGWQVTIPSEKEFQSIEFVFTDGQGKWDNNNGLNWELSSP